MAKKEFEPVGALPLKIPFKVKGTLLKALHYDFTQLTAEDLIAADLNRIEETGSTAILPSIDQATSLQLFTLAVSKVMPDVDYMDIKRMSALDASKAVSRTKRFFSGAADEDEESEESQADQTPLDPMPSRAEPCADGEEPTFEAPLRTSDWSPTSEAPGC